ncbi:hypothetical protein NQ317_004418 [Molorchus minor]|uniref:LIM zinc-binding domain-containing protein n=1 Tax=Molorchus minor TaxID=1323400 RepID=A0ABQ9IXR9_9CUCU|nr:hypothetical protein NQ317_004418 [Molorchus minor]
MNWKVHEHEGKVPNITSRTAGTDEDLAARIKSLEQKWLDPQPVEKKPKDLLRAIGKIETSDWNVKEIEKKIMENKLGKPSKTYDKEKVPKWSKEQFLARQTKMEKQHLDRQDSAEAKFAEIDKSIKSLDQKLKEGTVRELGLNKVASITEKLVSKVPAEPKPIEKSNNRPPVTLPTPSGSEFCHFCGKRVYLMERLSAEGRFFHHGCFKCQYCQTQLRLGSYAFDRDGMYGFKFFCLHHYGMVGELPVTKVIRKPSQKPREVRRSPEKRPLSGVAGVDLLDRVQTPERIEFSNLSTGNVSSDHEESLSQMDEDEWTDKNFGASCAENDSEDESSSLSDTDSDDEGAFDDALEEPVTKEGTMKWAERWKNSYSRKKHDSDSNGYSSSDQSSYYENSSDDDDSDTATEGEDEIRARELRKQEVRVEPPVVQTDTGTDTEVKSSFKLASDIPDLLSNRNRLSASDLNLNRSSSNVSVNSADFNSAESGDLDLNMNETSGNNVIVGKLTITPKIDNKPGHKLEQQKANNSKSIPLAKSATAGTLSAAKPLRNFVLPPKDSRKSFGSEFVPKFQSPEPEPLLIIKRTPSKINLPKEVGKPRMAVNTSVLDTKKYFGNTSKKPPIKKSPLQKSESMAKIPRQPLIKQSSLPETSDEKKEVQTFNFEPEDSDHKNTDDYIENLIANEDELHKPIDPKMYSFCTESPEKSDEEKVSSSIEDLLKALETETKVEDEVLEEKPDEKIEDLLSWMDGLDYDVKDKKVCRSFSDAKYKNLERVLKSPQRSDSVVSKIPKNNLTFFERHLAGKPTENSDNSDDANKPKKGVLQRSKTEVNFSRSDRPRSSVDLDSIKKVDIKKMLQKFESTEQVNSEKERSKSPVRPLMKRNSFASFRSTSPSTSESTRKFISRGKPVKNAISKFESEPKEFKKPSYKKENITRKPPLDTAQKNKLENQPSIEDTLRDLENFVEQTIQSIGNKYEPEKERKEDNWCVNITVSSIPNPQYIDSSLGNELVKDTNNIKEKTNSLNQQITDDHFGTKGDNLKQSKSENEASISETTSSERTDLRPHDFSKAVESTDTSVTEDEIKVPNLEGNSIRDNYKSDTTHPNDLSTAIQGINEECKLSPEEKQKPKFSIEGYFSGDDSSENKKFSPHNFGKAVEDSYSSGASSYEEVIDPETISVNKVDSKSVPKVSVDELSEEEVDDFLKIGKKNENKPSEDLYAKVSKNKVPQQVSVAKEQTEEENTRIAGSQPLPMTIRNKLSERTRVDITTTPLSANENKHLDLEGAAKLLNKNQNEEKIAVPQAPDRIRKHSLTDCIPQRPVRQKSFEKRPDINRPLIIPEQIGQRRGEPSSSLGGENKNAPVPPQRKKSTVSPLPARKTQLKPTNSDRSPSSSHLMPKKEVVSSYTLPKAQTVNRLSDSSESTISTSSSKGLGKFPRKDKDKDKDCCIQ